MSAYAYRGRNGRGEAVTGRIDALSADAVADQLINSGITPIQIQPAADGESAWTRLARAFRAAPVSLEDLAMFCRQMYTLDKAGVPILQALKGLRASTRNPRLGEVIGRISESLDAGADLTTALKRHPEVFPPLFVALVQVGETTGRLEEAFDQLGRYLDLEQETRLRVKAALRYPIFVTVAIVVAVAIINVFVIPAFARLYESFRATLPLPTRILIATSRFTVEYGWVMLGVLALTAFGLRTYFATERGHYQLARLKLKIPIVGDILYRAMLGRFARSLSMMIGSDVPLIQGMTVVANAVDNAFIASRILQMRDGVERGESLSRTAAATGMFSPLVIQMISVGEEAGAIDTLMNDVAEYYERGVDYDIERLGAAIEPVLIVAIGGLVLVLALGVFLPMWDLAQAAGLGH